MFWHTWRWAKLFNIEPSFVVWRNYCGITFEALIYDGYCPCIQTSVGVLLSLLHMQILIWSKNWCLFCMKPWGSSHNWVWKIYDAYWRSSVIVHEFSHGSKSGPVVFLVIDIGLEIGFFDALLSLNLTICLWADGGEECFFNT